MSTKRSADKLMRHGLQGVSFAVFGLGNKQYEHFCAVGKKVQAAMLGLGANALIRNGEGDDDEDIEADYDKWREEFHSVLEDSSLIQKPASAKVLYQTILESINSADTLEIKIIGCPTLRVILYFTFNEVNDHHASSRLVQKLRALMSWSLRWWLSRWVCSKTNGCKFTMDSF